MIRNKWKIIDDYKDVSREILSENLSSLRARIGITQEELAAVVGVSRQTYYSFESGERKMTWTMFLALLFFFDCIAETSEMIRELRIYPIDMILKLNDGLNDVEK